MYDAQCLLRHGNNCAEIHLNLLLMDNRFEVALQPSLFILFWLVIHFITTIVETLWFANVIIAKVRSYCACLLKPPCVCLV